MHEISNGFTHNLSFYRRWMQIVTGIRRHVRSTKTPRPARVDLLDARDDMLWDIGLLDGPDMVLRRSELTLPSEQPRQR